MHLFYAFRAQRAFSAERAIVREVWRRSIVKDVVELLEALKYALEDRIRAENNLARDFARAVTLGLHKDMNGCRIRCGMTIYPAQLLKDVEDKYPHLLEGAM
jgi:hypothetical protein